MTSYTNPVLDADFPDPSTVFAPDGWYYAYSSQHTTKDRWAHVPVARSRDFVTWRLLGDAMPNRPAWSQQQWEFAWAPHVIEEDGTYYLYYSAMPDTRVGMCIGVATSSRPEGPFADCGAPLAGGRGYITIDPMAFRDPVSGRSFLYWGADSWPLYVQELAPDLVSFLPDTVPLPILYPDSTLPYEQLVEGAFLRFRDGLYYLFYSGDDFGGDPANYAVSVARATSPLGPFVKMADATGRGSSVILERNARWDAPGHNSIMTDAAGQDWIVYHAIDPLNRWQPRIRFVRRPMLIDPLRYRDGWPVVDGGSPSSIRRPGPVSARTPRGGSGRIGGAVG